MGTIRFLLALVVVSHHLPEHLKTDAFAPIATMLDGMVAVLVFFVLSGFYMSLIINEKYSKLANSIKTFYLARFLRIYPLYYLALVSILIYYALGNPWNTINNIENLPTAFLKSLQILMNVTLFGLDFVPAIGGYTFQLIAPAWSLGTEVLFYIAAPWLVRLNSRTSIAIVLAVFSIRYSYMLNGTDRYPMRVLFPPLSICFFLLGHLSYLLLKYLRTYNLNDFIQRRSHWIAPLLVAVLIVVARILNIGKYIDPDSNSLLVFYVFFTVVIPFLFISTNNSRFDRFMGDMSYPLYLTHVISLRILQQSWTEPKENIQYVGLFVSIAVALVITVMIERPLDKWRSQFVLKH